jgi:ZIP family zinc transporter
MPDSETLLIAFALTIFAGLSTTIGAAIGVHQRQPTPRFLSVSLGLSAGVMLYVSFVEILPKSRLILGQVMPEVNAAWLAVTAFFVGIAASGILDRLLMPLAALHSPADFAGSDDLAVKEKSARRTLLRTGLFTAVAISIHNFPEGLVTFVSALQDPRMGIAIAIAVALHNIPEGIAVAVPIYTATGSRARAFGWAFVSGLAEPLGAALGYLLFLQFFAELQIVIGGVFSFVGGVMVYICLDELLPTAHKYGEPHLALAGVFAGMAVMAVSLLLLM